MIKADTITAHVRPSGGATRTSRLDRPLPIAQIRKFKPELVAEVDRLLDKHRDREIAELLNHLGRKTWEGKPFNLKKIALIASPTNFLAVMRGCAGAVCSRPAKSRNDSTSRRPPSTDGGVKASS
ncbi:hypothetical protein NKH09_28325 [Mesorhizobium sp. M1339]